MENQKFSKMNTKIRVDRSVHVKRKLKTLGRMESERTSEVVADSLIKEIKGNYLEIGATLPTERELCDRFGASRPTIREALRIMEFKGFLRQASNKRPVAEKPTIQKILKYTAENLKEILDDTESQAYLEQMRQFIEVGALRTVIESSSEVNLARIHKALIECHHAIGDQKTFAEADVAFHRAIVKVVDNPIMLNLHDMFIRKLLSSRPPVSNQKKHDTMVYQEHKNIYEAILRKDAEIAMAIMNQHLQRSYKIRLQVPSAE